VKCEKCGMLFLENEIEEHHIFPKEFGGTDKDGRIDLCWECHQGLKGIHKYIKDNLFIFTKEEFKKITKEWLNDS